MKTITEKEIFKTTFPKRFYHSSYQFQDMPEFAKAKKEASKQTEDEEKKFHDVINFLQRELDDDVMTRRDINSLSHKIQRKIDRRKENILRKHFKKVSKKLNTKLNEESISRINQILESEEEPAQNLREVGYCRYTYTSVVGDIDSGYEKNEYKGRSSYFVQAQRLGTWNHPNIGKLTGEIYLEGKIPKLRLDGLSIKKCGWCVDEEQLRFGIQDGPLNIKTNITLDEFIEGRRIIKPEDVNLNNIPEEFKELTGIIQNFIRLINRESRSPYADSGYSRVSYDKNTGEPEYIGR